MSRKKIWSSQHGNAAGVQNLERSTELRYSKAKSEDEMRIFGNYSSQDSGMLFYCNEDEYAVYGLAGKTEAGSQNRMTEYSTVYFNKKQEMMGQSFFDEIFGRVYLNAAEQCAESVRDAIEKKQEKQDAMTEMIWCVVERLWFYKEQNANSRLILLLPPEQILTQSVKVLRQVYRLLPQQLRLQTGFAVDARAADLTRVLDGKSVYLVTAKRSFSDEIKRNKKSTDIIFDSANWSEGDCDLARLKKIEQLWGKLEREPLLTDAKLAYAEQYSIYSQERRNQYASFRHMEKILNMVLGEANEYFWWENPALNSLDELYEGYCHQQEAVETTDMLTKSETDLLENERNHILGLRLTQEASRDLLFAKKPSKGASEFFAKIPEVVDLMDTLGVAEEKVQEANQAELDRIQQEKEELREERARLEQMERDLEESKRLQAQTSAQLQKELSELKNLKVAVDADRRKIDGALDQEKREVERVLKLQKQKERDIAARNGELGEAVVRADEKIRELQQLEQQIYEKLGIARRDGVSISLSEQKKRGKRKGNKFNDFVNENRKMILIITTGVLLLVVLALTIFFVTSAKNGTQPAQNVETLSNSDAQSTQGTETVPDTGVQPETDIVTETSNLRSNEPKTNHSEWKANDRQSNDFGEYIEGNI